VPNRVGQEKIIKDRLENIRKLLKKWVI
jgi:hypothetical protein